MQTKFSFQNTCVFQESFKSSAMASLSRFGFAILASVQAYVFKFLNRLLWIFFLLKEKEQIQNLVDPLTFDLTYDLIDPSSCPDGLCPILNDYNDIGQRTVRAEVSTSY